MSKSTSSSSRKVERSVKVITRACDMCRGKKIRCEVISEVCEQCIKYKTQCHFTPISVTRAPRRSVRDKRVEELETKLKEIENQSQRAVTEPPSQADAELGSELKRLKIPNTDQSHDRTSHLCPNIQGDDLLEAASTITEESPQNSDSGVLFEKASLTTAPDIKLAISPQNPKFVSSTTTQRAFKAFPPKDKALNLIQLSFQGFHLAFPLFHQATFMSTFESLDSSINDPGWWACLNVVLALAHQFRSAGQNREEDLEAWGYFQNALAITNQLMMMHATLSSVQALLGMSLVIMGTPDQGPISLLTSSAIKQAQSMGLHRRSQGSGLSAVEIEERKQVFWLAYILDKEISLQTGQPPTQDEDDMDLCLPYEDSSNLTYLSKWNSRDLFSCRVRLAIIQGHIYKRLCSVKASKQSVTELVVAANELEAMLQAWRANVPDEFIRDYCGPDLRLPTLESRQHPVILQLSYYNSLATLYSCLPVPTWYREVHGSEDLVAYQILSAPITYAVEARRAIKLLQVTPRRRHACIWAVLRIFSSAATTLLTHTLANPSNPSALADLKLIEPLLKLLGILARSGKNDKFSKSYESCMKLFERARMSVENFQLVSIDWDSCRIGRQPEERESVEDFLRRIDLVSAGYDVDLNSTSLEVPREFTFEY